MYRGINNSSCGSIISWLVPHLHLQHGPAHRGHDGLDVKSAALEGEAAFFGSLPDEAVHFLVVIWDAVVHLVVERFVTLLVSGVDADCQDVLVRDVVEGHGEHDGQLLIGSVALPLEVVGQHAHGTPGQAGDHAEFAHLSFLRAHGGLRGNLAVPAEQVKPFILNCIILFILF